MKQLIGFALIFVCIQLGAANERCYHLTEGHRFPHPLYCHMYMACDGEHEHEERCQVGLEFNEVTQMCVLPHESNCHPTTTTVRPTTTKRPDRCDPKNCTLLPGPDCHSYYKCNEETRRLELEVCLGLAIFRPDLQICIPFEFLSVALQKLLLCDRLFCPDLLPHGNCLKGNGDCGRTFWRRKEGRLSCVVDLVECPVGTVFNGVDGCGDCGEVFHDGHRCCRGKDNDDEDDCEEDDRDEDDCEEDDRDEDDCEEDEDVD